MFPGGCPETYDIRAVAALFGTYLALWANSSPTHRPVGRSPNARLDV